MPFRSNNVAAGLPPGSNFVAGRANVDANEVLEQRVELPWASDPAGSYVYYECTIGVMLDSGIVVHNRLPQIDRTSDTLASVALDGVDLDQIIDRGVNLLCKDQYTDITQRMGHARYWFRLWGQALRVGYRIPIPGLVSIGGVPAVPYHRNPEWAYNGICPGANYGGIPLWRAQWSLWYTTLVPPISNSIPVADPAAHISGAAKLPTTIQAPFSQADSNAEPTEPSASPGFATLR